MSIIKTAFLFLISCFSFTIGYCQSNQVIDSLSNLSQNKKGIEKVIIWLFRLSSDFRILKTNFYFNLVCTEGLTKLKYAFAIRKGLFCSSQTFGTD